MPLTPCALCPELAGAGTDTEFARTYLGDPVSRVLASTRHLRLIADLSPLVEGHALLLPVHHSLSFAVVLHEHRDEVLGFLDRVLPVYAEAYGDVTVLEHGSSTSMLGSACIHHAHLHLLPLAGDAVDAVMARDGLQAQDLDGLSALAGLATDDVPYFLRADGRGARLHGVGAPSESQYLRSVAAEVLGLPDGEHDWSAVVRTEALRATVRTLGPALRRGIENGAA